MIDDFVESHGPVSPTGMPGFGTTRTPIAAAYVHSDVKERMGVLGFEPVANTPEEFAARIKFEIPKWAKVIRDANIKAEP